MSAGRRLDPRAGRIPRVVRDVDRFVHRALANLAAGNVLGALAAWRRAVDKGASPELLSWARPLLVRAEGHGSREPPPGDSPLEPANAAWAWAWAGDLVAARGLAERAADDPIMAGLLGVLDVLERRDERALPLLDRAIAAGGGEPFVLHRVRALLHLGRRAEASDALDALVDGESFSRRVILGLVVARRAIEDFHYQAASGDWFYRSELPEAVGQAEASAALASPRALEACLEALLDRMAGNLGPSPTVSVTNPNGTRRFVRLELEPPPRENAVKALGTVAHAGIEGAEAAFRALRERQPRSPYTFTYHGELLLWLGRYDEAWRSFLAAARIEPTRWADIGMLAILIFNEHLRAARLMATRAAGFHPIRGATLPVYRGILFRRLGRLSDAIEDLRGAVEVKPTRVGARIELCLALRAAGFRADAVEHAAELVRDAAPLLVDAADAQGKDWCADPSVLVGDGVLEQALRAMRGNRSSSIVTWIDGSDRLRVLERPGVLAVDARRCLDSTGRAHNSSSDS
jgi:tetratricopeptide (TPR) repeat protein